MSGFDDDNGGGGNGAEDGGTDGFVVRVRGLPWSATTEEISSFFGECNIKDGQEGIHMTMTREGRPSGEAYIEMEDDESCEKAVKKDRQHMGERYVEVFRAKHSEMKWVVNKGGSNDDGDGGGFGGESAESVIRLRGLPYDCSKDDIKTFFEGLEITPNGILTTTDYQGRSSGEAFVQFKNKGFAERALEKNKESIGHRYIEIFRSSMEEASRVSGMGGGGGGQMGGYGGGGGGYGGGGFGGGGMGRGGGMGGGGRMGGGMGGGRPSPYDRQGGGAPMGRGYGSGGPMGGGGGGYGGRPMKSFADDGGYGGGFGGDGGGFGGGGGGGGYGGGGESHIVRMRGLPFRATQNDIAEWFSSVVDPVDINLKFNPQGKPNGEADVLFSCEADARKALSKDKQNMQHRYVELFYNEQRGGGGGGGGGGGFGGGGGGFGGGRGGGFGGGGGGRGGYGGGGGGGFGRGGY